MAAQSNRVSKSEKEKFTVTTNVVALQPKAGRHQALYDTLIKIEESSLPDLWEAMGMLDQLVDEKTAQVAYLQGNVADWVYKAVEEEDWNARKAAIVHSTDDLPEPLFDMMQGMHSHQIALLKEMVLRLNPAADVTPIECYQRKESKLFKMELVKLLGSIDRETLIRYATDVGNTEALEGLLTLHDLVNEQKA